MQRARSFLRRLAAAVPATLALTMIPAALAAPSMFASLSSTSAASAGVKSPVTLFIGWGGGVVFVGLLLFALSRRRALRPAMLCFAALGVAFSLMGCGGSFGVAPAANPLLPAITSLGPVSPASNGAAFGMTINGANFTPASTTSWAATPLATTYISAAQLTVTVPANLVATAGTAQVTVSTAAGAASVTVSTTGGTSPQVALVVTAPPSISSLSPASAVAGGAAFTLTINGTNFTSTATASWGATPLATTYISASKLTAAVPASLIAAAGAASVTVTTASGTSCGATFTIKPPLPTITSLSPNSVVAGGADFTLTVNGANFLPGAGATVVRWNFSTALATTYVSSTQVTAAVPASLITGAGTFNVSVVTAGGRSANAPFTINPAPPTITYLTPTYIPVGYGAFTLAIAGTHFTSNTTVNFGAIPLGQPIVDGSSGLSVTVPASLVATSGTDSKTYVAVTVTTAGGTSAPATFTITPPRPMITSLSPSSAAAGGPQFTLTINGTNFTPDSTTVIWWGSLRFFPAYVSSTQLRITVPARLIAAAGTAEIQATDPWYGRSNTAIFTINPAPPAITSLSPASVTAGAPGLMLTVNGTALTPGAAVLWGATPLGTIYVSPTQLTAAVPASLVANSGTGSITVTTAAGTSAPAAFTVNPAPPAISGLSTSMATAGGAAFTLTIDGEYFTPAAIVKWGSIALATTDLSATELTAVVPASLIAAAGTASLTVSTAAGTSAPVHFTVNPPLKITTATLPSGTAGNAYSGPITVTGGTPGYTWTVIGLPNYLTFFDTMDSTLVITGTPTSSGTVTFQVSVADTTGATAGPVSYTINFNAGPNGANNGNLSGSYVCLFQGSIDDDSTRWASVASIQADGQGHFTSGIFDTNSHDIGSASGIMTGNYNVASDNNGMASIHTILTNNAAGIQTTQWALALAGAAQPAQQFRMVEADDLGTLPSGQQGIANCYQATPSAFAASTVSGSSFAFGLDGEDNSGNQKASAGLFSASGGVIANGNIDMAQGGSATVQTAAFTGTYTAPDPATGRFTIALNGAGSSTGFTVYIIDAKRMFILDNTSNDGEQAGNLRAQQQASYSGASVSGPFVLYLRGAEFNSGGSAPSGFYADVFTGSGDGNGNMTINQSYTNDDGAYSASSSAAGPPALAFDSAHPGRATFPSAGGTTYLYLFDNNSAFEMSVGDNGSLDSGWLESQTVPQTQTDFTGAALAGNYLLGELPLLSESSNANVGEYDLTAAGSMNAALTTAGRGELSWDQSASLTYSWDATAPGAGTFLVANGAQGEASCAVISATKFVCASQTDPSPSVEVIEQ